MKIYDKLFIYVLLALIPHRMIAQNIFNYPNSIEYTNFLIDKGELTLAQKELDRLDSIYGISDTTIYLSLLCLQKATVTQPITTKLNELCRIKHPFTETTAIKALELAIDYHPSAIPQLLSQSPFDSVKKEILTIQFKLFNLDTLDSNTMMAVDPKIQQTATRDLINKLHTLTLLSEKKTTIYSILPGGGFFYAHQQKAGITAMVAIGTLSYLAFRGFDKYGIESIFGWINASASAAFYLSGIYTSKKTAKRYNSFLINKFKDDVRLEFKNTLAN